MFFQNIKRIPSSLEKNFYTNPLYFGLFADFGVDNEIENSSLGNETTLISKQIPVCNGYNIISELEDVLRSD